MIGTLIADGEPYPTTALSSMIGRIGAGLGQFGIGEGGIVAAMMRNTPAHLAVLLACRAAGVYLVEINWHFKAGEVASLLADSGAVLLFVDGDLLPVVDAGLPASVRRIRAPPPGAPDPDDWRAFGTDAPALPPRQGLQHGTIVYTSGTTGRPKGVRRLPPPADGRPAIQAAQRAVHARVFGVAGDSVALLSAPVYHSAPMSYTVHACSVGATLLFESSFDAERTLALIERHRVTHAYLVPTMYRRLLRLDPEVRARYDLSSIRQVASTGSPCPVELKRAMIDWWGPVITEAYASSETGYITFIDSADWLSHPGSAGRPVGAATIRILDDQGRERPTGEAGLIYARQPATPDFSYLNDEAARHAVERDGLVTLGDVGRVDADGYLTVCDRRSDMVISGGVNIYPAEIEAVLHGMPGVADCAVFGIPDPEFGEALAAAVTVQRPVGASETPIPDADAVRTYLRERIAGFKVPKVVAFHDALPREDTGKIFKRKLREPYWRDQGRAI